MTRFDLSVYIQPSEVQGLIYIQGPNEWVGTTVTIDTGAQDSLFPQSLLDHIEWRFIRNINVQQAGIAKQEFSAVEAEITVQASDFRGRLGEPIPMTALFTDTEVALLGFEGLLNQAILHIDMPRLSGYLDIE